jgi:hypothetical protein
LWLIIKWHKIKLQHSILKEFAQDGRLKQLAFYLQIKGYGKSVIYNYNYNKLSKISGLSWKTCQRYTKTLIKLGCCEAHGNNLLFKNQISSFPNNDKFKLKFEIGAYKHILNQLYYLVIKNNYKQQYYNAAKKYGKNRKVLKNLTKVIKSQIFFSSRSLAKILNVSNVTANKIVKKLHNDKVIHISQRFKYLGNMSYAEFRHFARSVNYYIVYRCGKVFRHQGIVVAI